MRLKKNALRCKKCGDVIESTHVHDFKYCKCGECFIDGGLEYRRAGAMSLSNIEDLCEYENRDER